MQALFDNGPVAVRIDVEAVRLTWSLRVDGDTKMDRELSPRRTHHEMKVPRMKAIHDPAIGTARSRRLSTHRPLAGQRPFIERQP
jgi:hypothetical protein